jgi:pimeloyl-ACP methyl ester carboxylesterase
VVLGAAALALGAPQPAAAELRLTVPLDHSGAVPGSLTLIVHRDSKPRPSDAVTLVLPESPGAPARDPYEWNPLMSNEQIVTFDPRGTGGRAPRCRDLEAADPTDAGRQAEACAALLGDTRRFFRAADTVEDIEALRAWLGVERLAIVGPGYGSYVAQLYALRYPEHVRRLILTAAVDAAGPDPLYRDSPAAARRILAELCGGPRCNRFTRDPVGDTRELVAAMAAAPLQGRVVDRFGRRRTAALTREDLFFLLLAGDGNPVVRGDYPAAVVSALRGDHAPLLRLAQRARGAARAVRPRIWSTATAAAATCEETRFPWEWHAGPAEREAAAQQAAAAMDPALADPFDPLTLARSSRIRLCSRWPTASAGPPAEPRPMPDVPVLLLQDPTHVGAPVETAMRTASRFAHATLLLATVSPLDECAERAVTRFMDGRRVPDRCPETGPLFAPTGPAPRSLREVPPYPGMPGRRGRLLDAFAMTFGDLIDDFFVRLYANPTVLVNERRLRLGGLRGGSWVSGNRAERFERYAYVPGVRVSGGGRGDERPRELFIDGPGALNGRVRVMGTGTDLVVRVRGRIAGRRVRVLLTIPSRLSRLVSEIDGGTTARAAALPLLP